MSMEERGKFEQETLSNYGGRKSSTVKRVTGDGMNELIVITIIAAVDGACPQNVVPQNVVCVVLLHVTVCLSPQASERMADLLRKARILLCCCLWVCPECTSVQSALPWSRY